MTAWEGVMAELADALDFVSPCLTTLVLDLDSPTEPCATLPKHRRSVPK